MTALSTATGKTDDVAQHLDDLDLTQQLPKAESLTRIVLAQQRLVHLRLFSAGLLGPAPDAPGLLVIFEGFDAAGKGGAIRRLAAGLDPRHLRVVPVGPPTALEARHHFLWRFQATLPAKGEMTVYDRSWYGRLLVERVDHLIKADAVTRSAKEIVELEQTLINDGVTIVKFFLHISDAQQLARFQERRRSSLTAWKLTEEDWHNRSRRTAYIEAADQMFELTDSPHAHWNLVSGEDKHWARATVLETLIDRWEKDLTRRGFEVPLSSGRDYLS